MSETKSGQGELDRALHRLLEVTMDLHACVLHDEDPVRLTTVREQREKAFESLRQASDGVEVLDSAARACLARIKVLDDEMLSLGAAAIGQLRSEKQALHRRRSAIQAHDVRERGEPLLLTVKA